MIKRYKEFKESTHESLSDIISMEEVEDQFLRLKEVLNYKVYIDYHIGHGSFDGYDYYTIRIEYKKIIDTEEFKQIKRRIEAIYPKLEMDIIVMTKSFRARRRKIGYENDIYHFYIHIKGDIEYHKHMEEDILKSEKKNWKKLED